MLILWGLYEMCLSEIILLSACMYMYKCRFHNLVGLFIYLLIYLYSILYHPRKEISHTAITSLYM